MDQLTPDEIWCHVHSERMALASDLESITVEEFGTPSLCPGWSVHDVLAHLVESALTTRRGFVLQMIRARGDFHRANAQGIVREKRDHPGETLAAFRAAALLRRTPPGGLRSRLVEAYVHGEDIRRVLRMPSAPGPDGVMAALDYVARTPGRFGGGKERVHGLALIPDDGGASIGNGAEVRGQPIDLLLAASGRPVPAGTLAGPGAARLDGAETA